MPHYESADCLRLESLLTDVRKDLAQRESLMIRLQYVTVFQLSEIKRLAIREQTLIDAIRDLRYAQNTQETKGHTA